DLPRPAFLHRRKQVQRVRRFVGKENVVVPILIDVDEAKAVVLPFRVDDGRISGQSNRQPLPGFFVIRPRENGALLVVADNQLALSVLVEVTEAQAAITSLLAREDRLALYFQPPPQ